MLELARDSRGLTQKELSEILSTTQATLSKYENGLHEPPPEFVEDVARALSYPDNFFFEPERPYGFPPFHYRKRKKLSSKALSKIVAEMNIKRMHIKKLSKAFPLPALKFPEIDRHEYTRDRRKTFSVDDAARLLREAWMLPRGPIRDLMGTIENAGGIIVECDFETDLLDAMSQRIDGLPILFFVNKNAPSDRIRHTLAHEIGHVIIHSVNPGIDDDSMEEEADHFAGAFLLPEEEVKHHLKTFEWRQLASLKLHWGVSIASLAVRADRLRLITQYQKKTFWIDYNKLGYRRGEPAEIPREKPHMLNNMIQYHMRDLGYTVDQMGRFLNLSPDEFIEIYLGRKGLRVVK